MLAAPWLGKWSDRVGRRPILLLSQAGTIVAYLLLVFAAPLGAPLDRTGPPLGLAGGLVVIYLARMLDGVTGGNISVAQAYASDISTPAERTRALGLVGGASGLGHILGPALAGLLAGINLLAPFWAAAVVSGVTLLLTLLWLHEPSRHSASPDKAASPADGASGVHVLLRRPVALILTTALVIGVYMAAFFGTFSLYADRVLLPGQSAAQVVRIVGLIITGLGLVMALTQMFLLKLLIRHLGEQRLALLGSLLLLVSAAGFFAVPSLEAVIICVLLFGLGYGIAWPTLQALLTRVGTEPMAGRMLGWFQATFSLALILGPIWGGYVFDAINPQAVFTVSAGLMALAVIFSIGLQRQQQALGGSGTNGPSEEATGTASKRKETGFRHFRH